MDKRNRLVKLARQYNDYEAFKSEAIRKSGWFFRPWVTLGYRIDNAWLNEFYKRAKGLGN